MLDIYTYIYLFISELSALEDLNTNRITRILTTDFPQYFAIVTRIRQEVHGVGPEGGMVSSTVVPQVQAIFPEGALTKKIRVGLQVNNTSPDSDAMKALRADEICANHEVPFKTGKIPENELSHNETPVKVSRGKSKSNTKRVKPYRNKSRWLSRVVHFLWPKLDVFSAM